jgi:hypothetical protein
MAKIGKSSILAKEMHLEYCLGKIEGRVRINPVRSFRSGLNEEIS